jgi:simple sugar transport system substrate-binding protein
MLPFEGAIVIQHKWKLISLALVGIIGIIAGAVYAASGGEAEVRISGLRHDDGRVELTLQQRDADGNWGERIRPRARIMPAERAGVWLNSSPLTVQVAAIGDAMPDTTRHALDAAELYCVVHHGADDDPFWSDFNLLAQQGATELGLTNLEIHGEPDVADHAAAIMDCVDRGALGIASSIPSLEGLRDALVAARNSRAFLVTFNSGAEVAGQVGSTIHYGLNDRAAGELAGQEFNDADVSGVVLCVLHEEANIGLDDRCDGLEATYEGSVERIDLAAGSLTDHTMAGAQIAAAIEEHQAAGALVLHGALIEVAIGAVAMIESDSLVGSIGRSLNSLVLVYEGKQLFMIGDGALPQATHVVLSMKNLDSSPTARAMLALTANQARETTTLLIRPFVLDMDYINSLPPTWKDEGCAIAARLAPDQVPSFCDE